jgi:zinc transport system ATP-binding protein
MRHALDEEPRDGAAGRGGEVVRFEHVWLHLAGRVVLEDVSFSIHGNDFFGIIGPNGGGKTTLIKVMLGLLKPTGGRVLLLGGDPEANSRYVGYVPQYFGFDADFPISVEETVLSGRIGRKGLFRRYSGGDRKIAREAMRRVGVHHLADRKMGSLSGGEKQRVFIARALVNDPGLLVLDEPTASVDTVAATDLYDFLGELNDHIPIILISHDIGVISSHVKRIACLQRRLFVHDSNQISEEALEKTFGCPVDLIAHGHPHRVFPPHDGEAKGGSGNGE